MNHRTSSLGWCVLSREQKHIAQTLIGHWARRVRAHTLEEGRVSSPEDVQIMNMAVPRGPALVAVLLLVAAGIPRSSPSFTCPDSCTCQRDSLLNCSSSGLSSVPQPVPDSVTELDLSHNRLDSVTLRRPCGHLRKVWLGNNAITHLSLCTERNLGNPSVGERRAHRLRPWSRRNCVSWGPTLQLLSVERNQLDNLPEGLEGSVSLRVLQLSFNRISTLQPKHLNQLQQLTELYLQHNLITSLHPQAFENMTRLRVLDLSHNLLTSLHPRTYLSLRNIEADVRLGGNTWQCDCRMRSLRRWIALDHSRGLTTWSVECALPEIHLGKDLLQLEDGDLTCFGTDGGQELHRDVTVHSGSEILMSCSAQDSLWWTPHGPTSVSQTQPGLFIHDVTEKGAGLYVCMSEESKAVSVFNLQISRIGHARRQIRSISGTSGQINPENSADSRGQLRNQRAATCNLTLAVCLSVFITFLVAFIIGVMTRPYIDVLCSNISKKKSPPATNSVSYVEEHQYDNAAFKEGEEPDEGVSHNRERRVTFSSITIGEDVDVDYYDTVNEESVRNVRETEREATAASEHRPGSPESDRGVRTGVTDVRPSHKTDFERIPDRVELEETRSLSSNSDCSLSDRSVKEEQIRLTTLRAPRLAEDSVQRNVDFSSEPFTEWSPLKNNTNLTDTDQWQENEEQFEYSDSIRSPSERSSVFGSFNDSKLVKVSTPNKGNSDISSSSSYISDDEPTQYTVNSDSDMEYHKYDPHIERHSNVRASSLSSDSDTENLQGSWPALDLQNIVRIKRRLDIKAHPMKSSASHSSCKDHVVGLKVKQELSRQISETSSSSSSHDLHESWPALNLENIPHLKRRLDISRTSSLPIDVSSSSDSEDETTYHTEIPHTVEITKGQHPSHDLNTTWPALDLQNIPRFKRRLDIKATSPQSINSSFSSDSDDESTYHKVIPKFPQQNSTIVSLPQCNDSSASSDSEDESSDHTERLVKVTATNSAWPKSQIPGVLHTSWPVLNLENIPHIKRRLDVKAQSKLPVSHSSGSEDEAKGHKVKQTPETVKVSDLLLKSSQRPSHGLHGSWPALDLENLPHIKRRLDFKGPPPDSDSSFSSDSEDEAPYHTERQSQVNITKPPLQNYQPSGHDLEASWPVLNLENLPHIKRRLDIKRCLDIREQSLDSSSSFSSDSEDESTYQKVEFATPLLQTSQTSSQDLPRKWPVLDLENIPHIKRRLDIKSLSQPSDSFSDSSKNVGTIRREQQSLKKVNVSDLLLKSSKRPSPDHDTSWPVINLGNIPSIKRRLDFKAPPPDSDSSFSSDSEDEAPYHTERQSQVNLTNPPLQNYQPPAHDLETGWPVLNLENLPHIKRRLDIKRCLDIREQSPDSSSSSSSDSEDESTYQKVEIATPLLQTSQTSSQDLPQKWPVLDLENIPHIKRRLDIKSLSQPSDSFSDSSKNVGTIRREQQSLEKVNVSDLLLKSSKRPSPDHDTSWPVINLGNIPDIKRRLDFKAPPPDSDSSFSSDSEDEAPYHTERQSQVNINPPLQNYQPSGHDLEASWPVLNLENLPHIKRRLDFKAPPPDSDSSFSSDSEDEAPYHTERQSQVNINPPLQNYQPSGHDLETSWPVLNLENLPHIKRRLDIKRCLDIREQSLDSSSSFSSDSEDESTYQKVEIATPLLQTSQTSSQDLPRKWPVLDLENIPHIKRRLDIKSLSQPSDSFSDSSKNVGTIRREQQSLKKVNVSDLLLKSSKRPSPDHDTSWPVINLGNIPSIKRRLDFKAPPPDSDSSFSSDSEDEAPYHTERQSQVNLTNPPLQNYQPPAHDLETGWPVLNLENLPHIKRRLDIKRCLDIREQSLDSSSSFSSDSEDESTYQYQPPSHDLETSWPMLNLEDLPHIKRRLDIKRHLERRVQYSDSGSSFSSDSEDELTNHEYQKVDIIKPPLQTSQTSSQDLPGSWSILDLENIPHIKRRLDIKPLLQPAASFTSGSNAYETIYHRDIPGKVDFAKFPPQTSQTSGHNLHGGWPVLNLENLPHIKRRLDIKRCLDIREQSWDSSSSFSSESEDEPLYQNVEIATSLLQTSQTSSQDLPRNWPVLDLENIPHIKRRLDIKSLSQPSDSFSDSSKNVGTTHREQQSLKKVNVSDLLLKSSKRPSPDHDTSWPVINLGNIPSIKRRLDFKAPPPDSDSSFSSDSEDEAPYHTERQSQVNITNPPLQNYQPPAHDLETGWPVLNLENLPHIKRRLDIKRCLDIREQSLDSSSSFSSDSEDESTYQYQPPSHDLETSWPMLNLEDLPHIKRRLDIKRHLERRVQYSDSGSSFSSDSEDELTNHIYQKVEMIKPPLQTSQTSSQDLPGSWSILDLENIPHIKRRLDIKPLLQPAASFTSGSNAYETIYHRDIPGKVDVAKFPPQTSQTSGHNLHGGWPVLNLENLPHIKRRLDFKAPPPDSDSSFSSDSEDDAPYHTERQSQVNITKPPLQKSQPVNHDLETSWPVMNLENLPHIKRRLDVRVPSSALASSFSSSDSEDETTYHTETPVKVDSAKVQLETSQTSRHDLSTGWPAVDLENVPRMKRRLDIKAVSPRSSDYIKRPGQKWSHSVKSTSAIFQPGIYSQETIWPALNLQQTKRIKRRLDIKTTSAVPRKPFIDEVRNAEEFRKNSPSYSGSSSDEEGDLNKGKITSSINVDSSWPEMSYSGIPQIKRRLAIKSPTGLNKSDNQTTDHPNRNEYMNINYQTQTQLPDISGGGSPVKDFIRFEKSPGMNIFPSPTTVHDVKLEKYTNVTDDSLAKPLYENISTEPEINSELKSRWATMNLGVSRFRRRLEITSQSETSPDGESGSRGKSSARLRRVSVDSPQTLEQKPVVISPTLKSPDSYLDIRARKKAPAPPPPLRQLPNSTGNNENDDVFTEFKGNRQSRTPPLPVVINTEPPQTWTPGDEPDSTWPHMSLGNIPRVKRALNIRVPIQTQPSHPHPSSEDRTNDYRNFGIPVIKRRLDIKAPSPQRNNSSSASDNEGVVTEYIVHNQTKYPSHESGITDDYSEIMYKRSIMKPLLPFSSSVSTGGKGRNLDDDEMSVGDQPASFTPWRVPSVNFEDTAQRGTEQSKSRTDVDLQSEMRWTGIGHHLSDFGPSTNLDDDPPAVPDVGPLDSPEPTRQDNVTLMHKYSYPVATRYGRPDQRERRGLSAIKAMSTERKKWETKTEDLGAV